MTVASRCLKDSIAVTTKTVRTKGFVFPLRSGSNVALNFTVGTKPLKTKHDHILKAAGSVFTRLQSLRVRGLFISTVLPDRHGLTHWNRIKLTIINVNNDFAHIL